MKIVRSLLVALVVGAGSLVAVSDASAQPPAAPAAKPAEQPKDAKPGEGAAPAQPGKPDGKSDAKPEEKKDQPAPAKATGAEEKLVYVKMTTSKGDIILELNQEKAPISVQNFLSYVDDHFYDGTIFHRVISNFMIQGGGFTPDMAQKKTKDPIKNEWQNGLKNTRGTVAMARLGDGRPNEKTVNSATAQFFINVQDNPFLDKPQPDGGAYAVFGKVIAGMDTVDKIKSVKTGTKSAPSGQPFADVPQETVTITSVTRMTPEDARKLVK